MSRDDRARSAALTVLEAPLYHKKRSKNAGCRFCGSLTHPSQIAEKGGKEERGPGAPLSRRGGVRFRLRIGLVAYQEPLPPPEEPARSSDRHGAEIRRRARSDRVQPSFFSRTTSRFFETISRRVQEGPSRRTGAVSTGRHPEHGSPELEKQCRQAVPLWCSIVQCHL